MYTFTIVGTSKSRQDDLYYSKERLKVWGSIFLAGVTERYWENAEDYKNNANLEFARRHGFDFYDVIPVVESNDKRIPEKLSTFNSVEIAAVAYDVRVKSMGYSRALMFNGKTSFYYFTYFLVHEKFDVKKFKLHEREVRKLLKDENQGYGRIEKDSVVEKLKFEKNQTIYLLPNSSGRYSGKSLDDSFDEFIWIESIRASNKIKIE